MMRIGKVINIKKTKNNVFILIKEKDDKIIQCVLRKKLLNSLENEIFLGDVISCNVTIDLNNNSKYKCSYPSFIINYVDKISKHIENLNLSLNIDGIKKYSLVKTKTREYFNSLNYVEVTLPSLTDDTVSSKAKSFKTNHYYSDKKLYLRKTMDPFLRILSCCGMNRVYSIGNIYRNEHVTALRQPESEMLSVFTAYASRNEMIKICLQVLKNLGYLEGKKIYYVKHGDEKFNDKNVIEVIVDYPISTESNAKRDIINNISNEFKIKYLGKTIIHGVEEICDVDDYYKILIEQEKKYSIGDLELLRNCIASGAVPCYNLGISLQRIVMLFDNLSIKDINPFPFSRFKIKELKK